MVEHKEGLESSIADRQNNLKQLKVFEAELKKLSNNEEATLAKIKTKKEELMKTQMINMSSQKAIETTKGLIA